MWSAVNGALSHKCRKKISVITKDGCEITSSQVIAEEFNTYFSNCAKESNKDNNGKGHSIPCLPEVPTVFHFKTIDKGTVLSYLGKLNIKKATGTGNISAKLLKMTASAIAVSVTNLFNYSLDTGRIPSEWKSACVTPVPKKGEKELVESYRPVSVLPIIAMIFEAMVHTQLYSYMETNSLIHAAQSGFWPQHRTQDVLIRSVDDWRRALDKDEITGTIMIDLSKAFDSVDHQILLEKLETYGVKGGEKDWFREYLSGRRQQVTINGMKSSWMDIELGVPQGSILGPLLFMIYMNDLPDVLNKCTVNLYADDATIYFSHKNPQEVKEVLERELEAIAVWIEQNKLRMNAAKTQLMVLNRRRRQKEVEEFTVQHRGECIRSKHEVRYLGVVVDEDLKWKKHIQEVRKKCFIGLSQMRRISQFLPLHSRKSLYNALVLPHIDYCCVIWHDCAVTLAQGIESIQTYGMRVITSSPP